MQILIRNNSVSDSRWLPVYIFLQEDSNSAVNVVWWSLGWAKVIEKEEEGSPRVISAFEVSVSQTLLRIV